MKLSPEASCTLPSLAVMTPVLLTVRPGQGDDAAAGGREDAGIADRRIRVSGMIERVVASHEAAVVDVAGGCQQPGHIDLGVPSEGDALRIDQPYLTVCGDGAVNHRWIDVVDAVESDGRAVRLVELHRLAVGYVERIPVDNRPLGGLVDSRTSPAGRDRA